MGKHNGKARKAGLRVGAALVNNARKEGKGKGVGVHNLHTTDPGPNPQSMLEASDLTELMEMANLADHEFSAEKQHVVVLNTTIRTALDEQRDAEARRAAEIRHAARLCIPRRPPWTPSMTAEQVDTQERASFLAWRRDLAAVEEEEVLVLTPFEKNIEMWRQLWRVVERSHVVVQVVDARDPVLYRSTDLEAYAREINPAKSSIVLLNKADLLTVDQRHAWAEYFEGQGVRYAFWSAKAATAAQQEGGGVGGVGNGVGGGGAGLHEGNALPAGDEGNAGDWGARLMGVEELLDWLECEAKGAAIAAGEEDPSAPAVVGLTGYPNVGKSSTINALYGKKKTAVAPTPGKTKHFQTLHVRPGLTLCDCPGLVLPRFAASKAEMVAAGVLPIDRLTETRSPVRVVAQRVGRAQVEGLYGIRLPQPAMHEDPQRPPTDVELLRSLALARGWVVANGLPDEARAARQILRDYTSGRLVWVNTPPNVVNASENNVVNEGGNGAGVHAGQHHAGVAHGGVHDGQHALGQHALGQHDDNVGGNEEQDEDQGVQHEAVSSSSRPGVVELTEADIDLLHELEAEAQGGAKPRRKEHKFHKKTARSKGNRGQVKYEGMEDGLGLKTGKKGGLVRVGGYV